MKIKNEEMNILKGEQTERALLPNVGSLWQKVSHAGLINVKLDVMVI